jgi:sulfatase maturation enzyme AslB (radical SAM superfamily)
MVMFDCKAITHAVTFLPAGQIAPCCVIKENYSKPIELLQNQNRFDDLQINETPLPCKQCVKYPENSYKSFFNKFEGDRLRYIDFRNSNTCNLKCRTCGPHASSSWAVELDLPQPFVSTDVSKFINQILDENIQEIYFAGGEPLLNADHWQLLDKLVKLNLSKNIVIRYSTNLTTLKYKDVDIFDLWKKFKEVHVVVSVDATEQAFDFIRSGASWQTVSKNIDLLSDKENIILSLAFTLSAISVWFLPDVLKYGQEKALPVNIVQLTDPHYYTLNVFPDDIKNKCIEVLNECNKVYPKYSKNIKLAINIANNNDDQGSFLTLINNILLTDKIRSESLFDLLPFRKSATKLVFAHQ